MTSGAFCPRMISVARSLGTILNESHCPFFLITLPLWSHTVVVRKPYEEGERHRAESSVGDVEHASESPGGLHKLQRATSHLQRFSVVDLQKELRMNF